MTYSDEKRLDFLEKWEVSPYQHTWFTLLTQHVSKNRFPTLRDFCDYAIEFEEMIDSNGIDILGWHSLPPHLQDIVVNRWNSESRPLSDNEKVSLQEETQKYWEDLHKSTTANLDK